MANINVLVLSNGEIIERGNIKKILDNPKEEETKRMIQAFNFGRAEIDKIR